MKWIRYFFSYLTQSDEYHEHKREETYLAGSADIHELEYRMRELKREKKDFPWIAFKRQ
jgi:Protein of unknown function (DUF3563)